MRKTAYAILTMALPLTIYSTIAALTMAKGGGPTRPPPPPVCPSATGCTSITSYVTSLCATPGTRDGTMYQVVNQHPQKELIVSYDWLVRHHNTPAGPQQEKGSKNAFLTPKQASNIGCRYTKGLLGDQIDEWSFTVRSACFKDDCSATNSGPSEDAPVQKPGGPRTSCVEMCDKGDPDCIRYEVQNSSPFEAKLANSFYKLSSALRSISPPGNVDFRDISSDISTLSGQKCDRTPLLVDSNGKASQGGSTCRITLNGASNDKSAFGPDIRVPGIFEANYSKIANGGAALFSSEDETSYWMNIMKQDTSVVTERITEVEFYNDRIYARGENKYCAAIKFNGG